MDTGNVTGVDTEVGRLHVEWCGSGPPVVLWHSLFVDSRSWGPVVDALAESRTVYAVDGPSHGRSQAVTAEFDFMRGSEIAVQVLDGLGLAEPVDWVGNAWGGHVGLLLAARHPSRLRTLATIGTPVQPFSRWELWTKDRPLVWLYQLLGPTRFLCGQLSGALLGADAVAAEPELAATVVDSFATADRRGMLLAIRSLMLNRTSLEPLLPRVAVPTLVLTARDDVTGWRPDEARATSAAIPDCRVEEVAGAGHVAPLLVDRERVLALLEEFWSGA